MPAPLTRHGTVVNGTAYIQLLDLACGSLLLTAVVVLWRRQLTVIIRALALQGAALAALTGILAAHQHDPGLAGVAAGILVLRAGVLPLLLHRALAAAGPAQRETRPLVNVTASLLAAAVLVLVAYAVSRPLTRLAPSPAAHAIPVAVAVVLIGFFMMASRHRALSQLAGFLMMDNGITAAGFLTTASAGLITEAGISLDVLLAVLVLRILAGRMRESFGDTDLASLRELHD